MYAHYYIGPWGCKLFFGTGMWFVWRVLLLQSQVTASMLNMYSLFHSPLRPREATVLLLSGAVLG